MDITNQAFSHNLPNKRGAFPHPFRKSRTSHVFTFSPTEEGEKRQEASSVYYRWVRYNNNTLTTQEYDKAATLLADFQNDGINWIQIEGLQTTEVKEICDYFKIHQLTVEDILNVGQRAKMDETEQNIFCLIPRLLFNRQQIEIGQQQISFILMQNTLLSFIEIPDNNPFVHIEMKLDSGLKKLEKRGVTLIFHNLLDKIVDDYYQVIEEIGLGVEELESQIIRHPDKRTLMLLNKNRQSVGLMHRTLLPVRDVVTGLIKTEHPLIRSEIKKYFKDVYDHALQASEIIDSYRDLILNLQSLYINQVSLKMNEIMKLLAVVTALFAPLTLIAGIYGMNFDYMPELHTRYGYFVTLGVMGILFLAMLYYFKKKRWF